MYPSDPGWQAATIVQGALDLETVLRTATIPPDTKADGRGDVRTALSPLQKAIESYLANDR